METKSRVPRDFYIRKPDAEKHGYTRGCPGCDSWFKGLSRQAHTAACRERFRGLMKEDARVVDQAKRKREFEEREKERKERKEQRRKERREGGGGGWSEGIDGT